MVSSSSPSSASAQVGPVADLGEGRGGCAEVGLGVGTADGDEAAAGVESWGASAGVVGFDDEDEDVDGLLDAGTVASDAFRD